MTDAEDCAAYDAWKAGTRLFPIMSQTDLDTAIGHFEAAKNLKKKFARARGWLAYCAITGLIDDWKLPKSLGGSVEKDIKAKARKASKRAVELDPCDFDTHWARGFVLLHTGDPAGAAKHFDTARRLNYDNRELLAENADERVYAGDPDKAIDLIMRARSIPDWQRWVLAWAYYFKAGSDPKFYSDALAELKRLKDQPGSGKAPAEILILRSAILAQNAKILKGRAATIANNKAKKDKDDYKTITGKTRSLRDLEDTNPFANAGDKKHWLDGLTAAGWT
jgi:tetratricopeptide (TPR) repeat protein